MYKIERKDDGYLRLILRTTTAKQMISQKEGQIIIIVTLATLHWKTAFLNDLQFLQ